MAGRFLPVINQTTLKSCFQETTCMLKLFYISIISYNIQIYHEQTNHIKIQTIRHAFRFKF